MLKVSYLGHFGAKILIYFSRAVGRIKNTAGLELVGLSRVSSPENLAIVNSSTSLCISNLKKIGRNKINEKIKSFQTYFNNHSLYSSSKVEAEIRMAEIRIAEIRVAEIRIAKIRVAEIRMVVSVAEKVREHQHSPTW